MRELRTAEIIAVGSELVTPHRIDTNSLSLTGRLNDIGIVVRAKAVVGDDAGDLSAVLRAAIARADVVITTGGLGPTEDDLTREVVAETLHLPLEEDAEILETIRRRFARRGVRMPEINRRQAMVPRGATALPNPNGTAPGLLIETGGQLVILLPGPPREMQPMFDTHIAPRLAERAKGRRVLRRVIKITGRSESQVEELAQPIYAPLREAAIRIETTILASPGLIELHLSASSADVEAAERALDAGVAQLAGAIGDVVFSTDGRALEEVVGSQLKARGWKIAVAESCTGGLVLGRLTDIAGSSEWVIGGVVAYANEGKIEQLGVPAELIAAHGAVSEPVAKAMAEGVRTRLHAAVGLAITGIAGPSGGTPEKPVGTVVVAIAASATEARTFQFVGDREMIRRFSTAAALDMVRRS